MSKIVTAAMVAIGDELLSGRTRDRNIGHLAECLTLNAIDLKEVRIVADDQAAIITGVNALRATHDHVFTSGGIGPTHDDITADAIAAAFGVGISHHPIAMKLLGEHYRARDIEFTEARKRMARIPDGAKLIANPVSVAPGFNLQNVYVMAGVPAVFQAMLDEVLPGLESGVQMLSHSIVCPLPEGTIGDALGKVQQRHCETSIGSYPRYENGAFSTSIVVRGREKGAVASAVEDVEAMLAELSGAGHEDASPFSKG